jgi:hypothetical protein
MTQTPGPEPLEDIVDRLEEDIVDVDRAADSDGSGEDTTRAVPGAPEPPD